MLNLNTPLNETDKILGFSDAAEMQQHYLDNYDDSWAGVS